MRCRMYHNTVQTAPTFLPGPLPEARGFFCPSEKKPRPAPAPSSAAPGIRLFILLQSSRFLTLRGPVSPKRPVLPIHLRDRSRPSRPRPTFPDLSRAKLAPVHAFPAPDSSPPDNSSPPSSSNAATNRSTSAFRSSALALRSLRRQSRSLLRDQASLSFNSTTFRCLVTTRSAARSRPPLPRQAKSRRRGSRP